MVNAANLGRDTLREISERNRLDYLSNPKLCKECGEPIPYEKRNENTFCNSSCSAKSSNRGRKKAKNCLNCGKDIPTKNIYCSVRCQKELKFKETIESWLAGETNPSTQIGCSATLRRFLLEESNNRCSKCGWNETNPVTNRVPLEINHKDGDCKTTLVKI